jgi:biopolymer transport protein ExbD
MAFHPTQHGKQPLAEINMIPLIDVMLVLLIVFIVAAPMLTHAVKIELPKATSTPLEQQQGAIQLSIKADGSLYWNGEASSEEALPARMRQVASHQPQPEVHLQADARTPYETVARVMAMSARAGLGKIGFVSEPLLRP